MVEASALAGFAKGLGGGLSQGVTLGMSLDDKKNKEDLAEETANLDRRQLKLDEFTGLVNILKIKDPGSRAAAFSLFAPSVTEFTEQDLKPVTNFIKTADEGMVKLLGSAIQEAANLKISAGDIITRFKENPTAAIKFLDEARKSVAVRKIEGDARVTSGEETPDEIAQRAIRKLRVSNLPGATERADIIEDQMFERQQAGQRASKSKVDINAVEALTESRKAAAAKTKKEASLLRAKDVNTLTFVKPNGEDPEGIKKNDSAGIDKALKAGKIPVTIRLADLGGLSTKDKAKFSDKAKETTQALAKLSLTLSDLRRLGPGVTGVRGAFGEWAAGIAGQFSEAAGGEVSRFITGATPQEVADFRLNAQAIMAQEISTITGEQSGRISEPERTLTEKVTKGRSPTASFEQVQGAFGALVNLKLLHGESLAFRAGQPSQYPVNSNENINKTFFRIQKLFPSLDEKGVDRILDMLDRQQLFFMTSEKGGK